MIRLEWITAIRPTVFHAAAGLAAGRCSIEPQLSEALGSDCHRITDDLLANGIPPQPFWNHLIVLSAPHDAVSQIVPTAIRKLRGISSTPDSLVSVLTTDVSKLVQHATPRLITPGELEMRSEPLRQQWEAFGPGLMTLIANRTSRHLIVESCRVLLLQPVFGGGGAAHHDYNTVHLEAMLVNADERLPEVVRLAWLVAQLNHDLPRYSETIHRDRLPAVSGLATLPLTLWAAEELGLARLDHQTLLNAIERWLGPSIHGPLRSDAAQLASVVEGWWDVCTSGNYAWAAALAALDQLLRGSA